MMVLKSSAVEELYFSLLKLLWFCHLAYEALIFRKSNSNGNEPDYLKLAERFGKLHHIRLFQKPSKKGPVCQIDVQELPTPLEEELLRKTLAKGSSDNLQLPDKTISRAAFTNMWLQSLV